MFDSAKPFGEKLKRYARKPDSPGMNSQAPRGESTVN